MSYFRISRRSPNARTQWTETGLSNSLASSSCRRNTSTCGKIALLLLWNYGYKTIIGYICVQTTKRTAIIAEITIITIWFNLLTKLIRIQQELQDQMKHQRQLRVLFASKVIGCQHKDTRKVNHRVGIMPNACIHTSKFMQVLEFKLIRQTKREVF